MHLFFWQAAIAVHRHQSIGRTLLVKPVTFSFLTALAMAHSAHIPEFLALGQ
jgi:hypothetical protein